MSSVLDTPLSVIINFMYKPKFFVFGLKSNTNVF